MAMKFEPIPSPFHEITTWGARVDRWSFVITHNPDGFTATYKDQDGEPRQAIPIGEYGQFRSIAEAEAACRRRLRELLH